MSTKTAALPQDLLDGLKRLTLSHFRAQATDILQTATTQRWPPEQLLRTLLATEVAGRDAANQQLRFTQAGFPAVKTFDDFQLGASSVPPATVDYLASLEWLHKHENLCLIGPAGTGKTHLLLAAGRAAVLAGHRVKYVVAADLVELLYRGMADNTVGKVIDGLLRYEVVFVDELGFAPLDDTWTQLLFRFVSAAYERRSLGIASHWPFDQWGRFLPQPSTAASMLDRLLHHAVIVVTDGESFRMKEARTRAGPASRAKATARP
ncbi:MAG: IS21-like element helper ATPase IstB [Actinobacteria bacterium]|nr:IS21-like element helper ATPase IstB [Actinomycetota bacterium]